MTEPPHEPARDQAPPEQPASTLQYVPILKGRMGELRALQELGSGFSESLVPLVEVPLTATDTEDDSPDAKTVGADPEKFAVDLKKRWPKDRRLIVDASLAPDASNGEPATATLIRSLAIDDFTFAPTIRPSDSESVRAWVLRVFREWNLDSLCIRLAGEDLDDNEVPLPDAIEGILSQFGVTPDQVDLVLDFGAIADENAVSLNSRIARLVLGEVPYTDSWRTLVCAGAGFPPDLNLVQPGVLTEIPRHDAALWSAVRTRRSAGRVPDFGDYGIAYPTPTGATAAFAPAPQIRFTHEVNWLIFKGRKRDRRGSAQFFDICERVVERGVVDPDLSWGDQYVDEAGRHKEAGTRGPGNAMTWRAIGTSHHLAYVATRLATLSAP